MWGVATGLIWVIGLLLLMILLAQCFKHKDLLQCRWTPSSRNFDGSDMVFLLKERVRRSSNAVARQAPPPRRSSVLLEGDSLDDDDDELLGDSSDVVITPKLYVLRFALPAAGAVLPL